MPNAGAPIVIGDVARAYTRAQQATVQAMPAAVFTAVTFDGADDVDSLGIHDPVTNNSRLVIGTLLGWWLLIGHVAFGAGSARGIRARLFVNGTTSVNGTYDSAGAYTATAGGFQTANAIGLVQATAAADYVQLQGYTDNAINTVVSGDLRCTLTAIYQGP